MITISVDVNQLTVPSLINSRHPNGTSPKGACAYTVRRSRIVSTHPWSFSNYSCFLIEFRMTLCVQSRWVSQETHADCIQAMQLGTAYFEQTFIA